MAGISDRHSILDRWTILILPAVGLWLIWAAGHYTVFDDEAFSCQRYVMPMGEMVSALWRGAEPDPPVYYVLQNLSVRLFGISPLGLRGLSICMFLVGLIVMRKAAALWFDQATGKATLIICALHPAHLFLGFAARWYSTMFLVVGLLLYATRRLVIADGAQSIRRWVLLWALSATVVCYTNYFGPVVVGLLWIIMILRERSRKRWLAAGVIGAILFAPWLPPFWRQLYDFPRFNGGTASFAASAGRTVMALFAGNLASHRAWWVWVPMTMFAIALIPLLINKRNQVLPIILLVVGCLVAGALSRTIIDKYVLTFSGPACMIVAATLATPVANKFRRARQICITALTIAWLGCGINLITEKDWSSMRWLDPFETAIADAGRTGISRDDWSATHPSARYYAVRATTNGTEASSLNLTTIVKQPWQLEQQIIQHHTPRVLTIEAAGFADSAEWTSLLTLLNRDYQITTEKNYLEDPSSQLKDQLDPQYHHPHWRIVVRSWQRRS